MAALLYAPVFSVVTRRFPHDFRRAIITLTFFGRSGQHGVHPSDRQSDPWFGVATGVDVAGLNPSLSLSTPFPGQARRKPA